MTTCNDIVRMAMGRIRQLRAGENPQGNEAADGMIFLQGLYDGWVSSGLFGRLNDTVISSDYTALEQDRVINDSNYNVTLPLTYTASFPTGSYYPTWPDDRMWAYLQSAQIRPPRDLAMVEILDAGALKRYLYSAHLRQWVQINGLALTDTAPLAEHGAMGLASCLAEVMGDEYGEPVGPNVREQATQFKWGLSSKYDSQRVGAMQAYF